MQKRRLGRTGFHVSLIGCGGIPIFRAEKPEAVKVIQRALDLGVNYFDTARGYADGASEDRIGAAIEGRRNECYITSKSGDKTRDGMLNDIGKSLETLGINTIDVYMCHGVITPDDLEKVLAPDGAVAGLKEAQKQGKIRFTGISGHRPEVLMDAIKTGEFDVILVPFNFVKSEPADELIPLANELDVGVTIMKPIGGSLFQHPDLCLRWVAQHDIHTIAVGMWKICEVEQNVEVGENPAPLNDEEKEWLRDERLRWDRSYCRLCYKCSPCEQGINIRELMIADLNYRRFGIKAMMERGFADWIEGTKECVGCEKCVESCAYSLPIPDLMKRLRMTYEPVIEEYRKMAG